MGTDNALPEGLEDALLQIWNESLEANRERLEALELLAAQLLEKNVDEEARSLARSNAHKLAGGLGMFGLHDAGLAAREIETMILRHVVEEGSNPRLVSSLVERIREAIEAGPQLGALAAPKPLLVVASADADEAKGIASAAAARGFDARTFRRLRDAREFLEGNSCEAIIVDLGLRDGTTDAFVFVKETKRVMPRLPVLVVADHDRLISRVGAARVGADAFMRRPLEPAEVQTRVEKLVRPWPAGARIIAVDDDPQTLGAMCLLFPPLGLEVIAVDEPMGVWDAITKHEPSLLILDVDMPHLDGVELCRVVRSDAQWGQLPILFLTSRIDGDTVGAIFAAGADDFVPKPIVPATLIGRVRNRLSRSRASLSNLETDFLTGLPSRPATAERLRQILVNARRSTTRVVCGLVDVDLLREINEQYGDQEGDRVLVNLGRLMSGTFGMEALVGRWSDDQFLFVVRDVKVDEVVHQIEEVERELGGIWAAEDSQIRPSFTAGVAAWPDDALESQSALVRRLETLVTAGKKEPDRIVMTGRVAPEAGSRPVDVVLVEDDEAVASLAIHALRMRGYRVEWFRDGLEAAEALSGAKAKLRPRLVLTDVDLPSLDGFSLIRRLRDSGALRETRVIVLSVRASERDEIRGLDLGAVDYVMKPFSLPVLIQRVRRVLES